MYLASITLFLLVLPVASVGIAALVSQGGESLLALGAKWYVFWAVGIRLGIAGIKQLWQPHFTATEIFGLEDPKALAIVREVGMANLAQGTLGVCTMMRPAWLAPTAVVAGLYYGLAGLGHIGRSKRNAKEYIAMISDFFAFAVLAVIAGGLL